MQKPVSNSKIIVRNKTVSFHYDIIDTYICGLALLSWEVKSIRQNRLSFRSSYVTITDDHMVLLKGVDVVPLHFTSCTSKQDRARPILLRKKEINILAAKIRIKGLTLVPLDFRLVGKLIKCNIALVKGKTFFDKRRALKERAIQRDIAIKNKL